MTREEIIKWLESLKAEIGKVEHRTLWHYDEVIDVAIEAPQDRQHGEWEEYTDCEGKTRTITCSECGWEEHSWIDTNYCPNCGAKMKGENNG